VKAKTDINGKSFGRLTVLSTFVEKGKSFCKCLCSCGKTKTISKYNVVSGNTASCGCYWLDAVRLAKTTHGASHTREYRIWRIIWQRCANPQCRTYRYYGGRGIKVCDRWKTFENFIKDMGLAPHKLTLERKNNNGDYLPSNCRWDTRKTQANNRRSNVLITHNGVTLNMRQWEERLGLNRGILHSRLKVNGMSVEKSLCSRDCRAGRWMPKRKIS